MFGWLLAAWKWLTPWLERAEPALRWVDRAHFFYVLGSLALGAIGAAVTYFLAALGNIPPYLWVPLAFTVFFLPPIGLLAFLHIRDRWHATPAAAAIRSPIADAKPAVPQKPAPPQAEKTARQPVSSSAQVAASLSVAPKIQFDERLNVLFSINAEKRLLWLKYLPDSAQTRDSDAMLALLFGYKEIFHIEDVKNRVLKQSLLDSKVFKGQNPDFLKLLIASTETVDPDDIFTNSNLFGSVRKHGLALALGGVFSLTESGYTDARAIVMDLIDRAH